MASHRLADFITLAKPRLNLLVLVTTAAGLYLASPEGVPSSVLLHTLIGTALVAGGAAALNQVWERHTDALMRRTQRRPVASGRLRSPEGWGFGLALSTAGLVELALGVNVISAAVAGFTLGSYVLVYTPLKRRTSLATLVGGVPGALPVVIGWVAATGTLTLPAFVLFGIVFFWQMPHFLAIAWLYRDDYAAAGIPLLPVLEPDGRRTGRQALLYSAALWPVSLMPPLVGLGGRRIHRHRDRAGLHAHRIERPLRPRPLDRGRPPLVPLFDHVPAAASGSARRRPTLTLMICDW